MRRLFLFSLMTMVMVGCTGLYQPAYLPILSVDDAHYKKPNYFYHIPAGKGFVLDATDYQFDTGNDGDPNYVQVQIGNAIYEQPWNPDAKRQSVTIDKLEPVDATTTPPLQSFDPNVQIVVSIGLMSNKGAFHPYWVGTILTN